MALDGSSPMVVRDAGLMAARDLAAAAQPSLFLPALPALLPRLLACAAEQEARELAAAADEALEALLARAPPQGCLGLLVQHLPPAGAKLSVDRQRGAELHAAVRCLRRVVARMQPAGLAAHLQPHLLPGLCAAYGSPLSDVRKVTVDCLVAVWQVCGLQAARAVPNALQGRLVQDGECGSASVGMPPVGSLGAVVLRAANPALAAPLQVVGDALRAHLEPLSASQLRLLTIYYERSVA